jgi:predicted Zn-dependent protease
MVASWRVLAVALLCVGASSCTTVQTTAPGAVGIDRKQRMLVSNEEVAAGAEQAYAQELQKARTTGNLNTDPALTARVRRVSERLIPVTSVFRPDAPAWKWEINTLKTDDMNAYAMPGGKIMVYSGLVQKLKLTDAELAAVLGHEISHALREHTRERVSRAYAQQLALAGVAVVTGAGAAVDLANQVATVTFQLPHSREQEAEADVMGLELMARAGYDPHAAVSVWQKMMAAEQSGGQPEFLSTHPSPTNRISELQAHMTKVIPLYQAAPKAPAGA